MAALKQFWKEASEGENRTQLHHSVCVCVCSELLLQTCAVTLHGPKYRHRLGLHAPCPPPPPNPPPQRGSKINPPSWRETNCSPLNVPAAAAECDHVDSCHRPFVCGALAACERRSDLHQPPRQRKRRMTADFITAADASHRRGNADKISGSPPPPPSHPPTTAFPTIASLENDPGCGGAAADERALSPRPTSAY